MDRGSWWATVHGVAKSQTWLSDFSFSFYSEQSLRCVLRQSWVQIPVFGSNLFFSQRVMFIYLATPQGLWDLNSPTKDWTHTPCTGRQSLIHWISGQVLEDKFWFPYWFMELGKTGQYRGSWGLRFLIWKMGLISSYLVELSWETNEINISSKLPDTECV